jgi:hypothetical protein
VRPFIVFALPRSRTAWMANFLRYGSYDCHHDPHNGFKSVVDLVRFLTTPWNGASDSAMALLWPEISRCAPDGRYAVVRRPIEDVRQSALAVGLPVPDGVLERLDWALTQVEKHRGVLRLDYDELDTYAGCAALFEHCLDRPLPHSWWDGLKNANIQIPVPLMMRRAAANADGLRELMGPAIRRADLHAMAAA